MTLDQRSDLRGLRLDSLRDVLDRTRVLVRRVSGARLLIIAPRVASTVGEALAEPQTQSPKTKSNPFRLPGSS